MPTLLEVEKLEVKQPQFSASAPMHHVHENAEDRAKDREILQAGLGLLFCLSGIVVGVDVVGFLALHFVK